MFLGEVKLPKVAAEQEKRAMTQVATLEMDLGGFRITFRRD